ncbi:MAG: pilus assembly protein [Acidimicrobiales bacterium]
MTGSDARRRSARRCSGDQGVAIIEAALIMPVFLVLVFGIFEYGVVFRDYLTAADATAEAAKIAPSRGRTSRPAPARTPTTRCWR